MSIDILKDDIAYLYITTSWSSTFEYMISHDPSRDKVQACLVETADDNVEVVEYNGKRYYLLVAYDSPKFRSSVSFYLFLSNGGASMIEIDHDSKSFTIPPETGLFTFTEDWFDRGKFRV